jgi:DNA-binding NarL/FixJ family response regulator
MTAEPLTCVVADDHPAVSDSVCRFLESCGIAVVARVADGAAAADAIELHRPTVAVLDHRMPVLGGLDVARRSARSAPETAIVLYTGYSDGALLNDALDAGVRGVILKEAPVEDLLRAVRTAAAGGVYLDPVFSAALVSARSGAAEARLTPRQREVLRLLADGLRYEEIGRRLFIAPETARTHVRKAMEKLGVATRTAAVAAALRRADIA